MSDLGKCKRCEFILSMGDFIYEWWADNTRVFRFCSYKCADLYFKKHNLEKWLTGLIPTRSLDEIDISSLE